MADLGTWTASGAPMNAADEHVGTDRGVQMRRPVPIVAQALLRVRGHLSSIIWREAVSRVGLAHKPPYGCLVRTFSTGSRRAFGARA